MRTHSDLLTTSSPSEGKVRSIGGKCSRWRMRASCVITFALVSMVCSVRQISELVSMKLLHVVKLKFDTSSPDLAKFVQAQQKTKYGFFTKIQFFSIFFPLGLQLFGSFKLLVHHNLYNYIQYIIICMYIYIYIDTNVYTLEKGMFHIYQNMVK